MGKLFLQDGKEGKAKAEEEKSQKTANALIQ